jgi:hypothetical protein
MRALIAVAIALSLFGCRGKESRGVLNAIHQTVDEARARQKIQIDITTEQQDPSPSELQLQQTIEKQIEREHAAHVTDDGSGPGYVRISVEVDDKKTSIEKLRGILRAAGVLNRSTVKILQ